MALAISNDPQPTSSAIYQSRSIDRAFAILECLSVATIPMSLIDISRAVGLSRSVTYRFLAILHARGYVHKRPLERVYSIGFGIYKLGRRSHALKTITRRPLAANSALATAGATAGVPSSPAPPTKPPEPSRSTSISLSVGNAPMPSRPFSPLPYSGHIPAPQLSPCE
jgi:hypothetical protein